MDSRLVTTASLCPRAPKVSNTSGKVRSDTNTPINFASEITKGSETRLVLWPLRVSLPNLASMLKHTPQALVLLFLLGLAFGCASTGPETGVSGVALEMLPRGADECEDYECSDGPHGDRCLDWHIGDDGVAVDCYLDCPRGGPIGAIAVAVDDEECTDEAWGEIHIVSCKDLSNVVLDCKDGREYKFDGLTGHYDTFSLADCEIVGVWVKAGNNASGDGPGYGEYFDLSDACDGTGGTGGNGGSTGTGGMTGTGGTGGIVVQ